MAGGFAGGLAQGIGSGVTMMQNKGLMDLRKGIAERDAEEHGWKKEDRDKAAASEAEWKLATSNELMSFRTDGSGQPMDIAAPQQSMAMKPLTERPTYGMQGIKMFAEGGLVQATNDVFAGRGAPSDTAGLSAAAPQQQAQPQQQAVNPENMTQELTRQMLSTDLLSNPDKLSRLSAIAEAHGMGDKFKPFLERAYGAKKQGLIDGGMLLMRGQVDEAIDALAKGGVKLEDRPTPADPKNPRMWNINISGAGEKTMDIADLLQTTLDVDKFLKHQMDRSESEGKRNVSDARVDRQKSLVRVDNARIGKLGEEVKSIKEERKAGGLGGSGPGKRPSDAQMVEYLYENKIVDTKEEGWKQVKTKGDSSQSEWRKSLITASIKNGMSPTEAAKEIDSFLGQSEKSTAAPPASAVRKFNPKTRRFE